MFNIAEQCSKAGAAFIEAQMASFQAITQAVFDGGLTLAEHNVDAFRSTLASGTVAAREIMTIPRRDAQ
jgi:hypothetical protein